ncbi:hypothetical protein N2152v2_000285 [Parachlorella kessleri]
MRGVCEAHQKSIGGYLSGLDSRTFFAAPCRAAHLERQHSARAAAGSPFATAVGPALRAQARPPASPSGARFQPSSGSTAGRDAEGPLQPGEGPLGLRCTEQQRRKGASLLVEERKALLAVLGWGWWATKALYFFLK